MKLYILVGERVIPLIIPDAQAEHMQLCHLLDRIFDEADRLNIALKGGFKSCNGRFNWKQLDQVLESLAITPETAIVNVDPRRPVERFSQAILADYFTNPPTANINIANKLLAKLVSKSDIHILPLMARSRPLTSTDLELHKDHINTETPSMSPIFGEYNYPLSTPLHFCAYYGYPVDTLLAYGADLKLKNSKGATALHLAVKRNHVKIVEQLIAGGADIHDHLSGRNALHLAVNNIEEPEKMVDLLIQKGADVKSKNTEGQTIIGNLMALAAIGNRSKDITLRLLQRFIEEGVEINASDNYGKTAFYYACQVNELALVSVLLRAGANPNVGSTFERQWDTPLTLIKSSEIVEMSVKHGAVMPDPQNFSSHLDRSFIASLFFEFVFQQLLKYLPLPLVNIIGEYVARLENEVQQQVLGIAKGHKVSLLSSLQEDSAHPVAGKFFREYKSKLPDISGTEKKENQQTKKTTTTTDVSPSQLPSV